MLKITTTTVSFMYCVNIVYDIIVAFMYPVIIPVSMVYFLFKGFIYFFLVLIIDSSTNPELLPIIS